MKAVILIKRIYEGYSKSDGFRILVDRLWPRGLTKQVYHVVTLLYGSKDEEHNHALILVEILKNPDMTI